MRPYPCIALCAFFHKAGSCPFDRPSPARHPPASSSRSSIALPRRPLTRPLPCRPARPAGPLTPGGAAGSWPWGKRPSRWPGPRSTLPPGWGASPAGGVIVAPAIQPAPHPRLRVVAGDHPEPGSGSLPRPRRLGRAAAAVAPEDEVWVLLSGGATSLLAAPSRGRDAPRAHRALPPPARLRSRHHRHEPHPEALLPLGRRPVGPGAGPRPGPGIHRLRRHRRRPCPRSAPAPASPTSPPPPKSGGCSSARASGIVSPPPPGASSRRRSREKRRKRQSRETRPSRG